MLQECLNRTGLQCAVFDKELLGAAFGLVDLDNFELTGIKEFTR